MKTPGLCRLAAAGLFVLAPGTWALAQGVIEDGRVVAYEAQLQGYPEGSPDRAAVNSETVSSPGAAFLRIHFASLNLAPSDYLTISDPKGAHLEILQGRGPHGDGDVWSFAIPGDTAVLTLHAGPRNDNGGNEPLGYAVDSIVHGTLPLDEGKPGEIMSRLDDPFAADPAPASVCGTVGYQNVACQPTATGQRSVARLLAVSGTSRSVRCTGWMVRGSNANTLMTNNHCFATQTAVRSIEAQFNYQTTTCTGTAIGTTTSFRGNNLLRTSGMPLDYTLATLMGNPEATFGEIIPVRRAPRVGELIWIIQHPAGRPKKIGHFEESTGSARCDVESLSGTQLRYRCDTEGGSSGSVVLAAGTTRAIGLHHLGGCPNNSATALANICTSAGALLDCE
jgi:lysyl endopeptidase